MEIDELENLVDFLVGANKIKKIERYSNKPERFRDSVAEHCFEMIVAADILIEHFKLELDYQKVVRYIFLHDWGEIGAATDICAFQTDGKSIDRKAKKEKEAVVADEFFNKYGITTYKTLYDRYNACDDPESKFVSVLDKVTPLIHAIANGYKDFSKYEPFEFTVNYPNNAAERFPQILDFVNAVKAKMTAIRNS